MKSLNSINKRLADLSDAIGRRETPTNDDLAWMHTLTCDEENQLFDILLGHNNLAEEADWATLTPEEIDLLDVVVEKIQNCPPSPPIDPTEPRCRCCGGQPALPRDGSLPLCDDCYNRTTGNWPHDPQEVHDCEHCEFALTGNAMKLQHVPCNFIQTGGFNH